MMIILCYVFLLSAVFSESVYSHRKAILKVFNDKQLVLRYDQNTSIYWYPSRNITFSYSNATSIVEEYTYSEDTEYDFLKPGKTVEYNDSTIFGYYKQVEIYRRVDLISRIHYLISVSYQCCGMVSMDYHKRLQNASFEEVNYIHSFHPNEKEYVNVKVSSLTVCTFTLCDEYFADELNSYTEKPNYRFDVDYQSISNEERHSIAEDIRSMFIHGYESYLKYAYPSPQLDPLSCSYARFPPCDVPYMTLIDTLDTLLVMKLYDEFIDAVRILDEVESFDIDENVSVFETTIRLLGGLESAHLLLIDKPHILEDYNRNHPKKEYMYRGHLLDLAVDLGNRIVVAFQENGLAYGTINLKHGIPPFETPISSLAGIGSSLLEFAALSSLTNNITYLALSRRCMITFFERRTSLDMLGKHINIQTGEWTERISCFGRNSDSYYEYLLKGYILLNDPQLYDAFMTLYYSFESYHKKNTVHWYGSTRIDNINNVFTESYSLSAFWPGVQFLLGDYVGGKASVMRFLYVWDRFGYIPEKFNIMNEDVVDGGEDYPLRPELIESMMYHDTVFRNGEMIHWGKMIIQQLKKTKTKCGFAAIKNIKTGQLTREMPSFMLSETLKYLYLLYDNESEYRSKEYLFTTEGHLFNISHIQSNPVIRSYIQDMNELNEENNERLWDLRCNAHYMSDFYHYMHSCNNTGYSDSNSGKNKPEIPKVCPTLRDSVILQSWFVYNDYVFYSYNGTYWDNLFFMPSGYGFPISRSTSVKTAATHTMSENQSVKIVLGNGDDAAAKEFIISSTMLSSFLKLMTQINSKKSETQSEEKQILLNELMSVLNIEGLVDIKAKEERESKEVIDELGYHVFNHSVPNMGIVTIRCQAGVRCELSFPSGRRMSINPIDMRNVVVTLDDSREVDALSLEEDGGDEENDTEVSVITGKRMEDAVLSVSQQVTMQYGNRTHHFPCVLMNVNMESAKSSVSTIVEEDAICVYDRNEKIVILVDSESCTSFEEVYHTWKRKLDEERRLEAEKGVTVNEVRNVVREEMEEMSHEEYKASSEEEKMRNRFQQLEMISKERGILFTRISICPFFEYRESSNMANDLSTIQIVDPNGAVDAFLDSVMIHEVIVTVSFYQYVEDDCRISWVEDSLFIQLDDYSIGVMNTRIGGGELLVGGESDAEEMKLYMKKKAKDVSVE